MVEIIWRFQVRRGREAEFERHYGSSGTWVMLFKRSPSFVQTELLRDREAAGTYLTIDKWESQAAYEAFHSEFAAEYQRIDAEMEDLTESETRVGVFDRR